MTNLYKSEKAQITELEMLRRYLIWLHNEVDCRIEHGANSGGHLEYVREKLVAVAYPASRQEDGV